MLEKILDSMQESVQVWDCNGKKLFSNTKAAQLYELDNESIQKVDDILTKWQFFDENDVPLSYEDLPPSVAMRTKKPAYDRVLQIKSKTQSKWIKTATNPILDSHDEVIEVVVSCLDITQMKEQESKYKNIANYDPLTKLPNRLLLSDRLNLAISHAQRNQTSVAVCMIDLDGFKALNDTHGHEAGDSLLVEVAQRMQKVVRVDDTVARLGGDEFVVILGDIKKDDDCAITLYRLLNTISATYTIDEKSIDSISASIGVSVYPDDKVDPEILLRHADIAMYKAKNSGKNRFCFFDIASDQKVKANFKALGKIKKGIEKDEFVFYYQPKINVTSGKVVEVEALARWNHPLLGVLGPGDFLPLVENDEELCEAFDSWAITTAARQIHSWQQEGIFVKMCVNISPRQFKKRDFTHKVKMIFQTNKIDLSLLKYLEFEILETAVVENLISANEIIKECQGLGGSFALDDFGTGYSSLMHLKDLTVDTIKIDKTFVMGMLDNSENLAIVQAVTALASAFDIAVTAEGAEHIEHVLSLMGMGCDDIQGFAIARPMSKEDIEQYLKNFVPDPRWKFASYSLPSKTDFELLLAQTNHKFWLEMALKELDSLQSDGAFVATECKFSKWFEKNRSKNMTLNVTFMDVDLTHKRLHQKAQDLFETIQKEKRVANEFEKEELKVISKRLISLLEKIRNDLVKVKKRSQLTNKILEKRSEYGRCEKDSVE